MHRDTRPEEPCRKTKLRELLTTTETLAISGLTKKHRFAQFYTSSSLGSGFVFLPQEILFYFFFTKIFQLKTKILW